MTSTYNEVLSSVSKQAKNNPLTVDQFLVSYLEDGTALLLQHMTKKDITEFMTKNHIILEPKLA